MTDPGQPGAQPPAGAPQPGQFAPPQGAPYPGPGASGATPVGAWQPPAGGPPQGGQPGAWGPPQPGFGQPQPGQTFGQPGPFGPGQPGPFGGPAPAGKPGKGRKIGSIAAAVAIAGGVAAFRLVDFGAPDVGDCVQRVDVSDVDIVDCGDSEAELRVVGIEDEKLTEDEYFADPDTCAEFASATDALWREGKIGSDGTVYCLEPVS